MHANNVIQLLAQPLIAVVQAAPTVVEESVEYTASTERVLEVAKGNRVFRRQLENACVAPLHSAARRAVGDTGFVQKELPMKLRAIRLDGTAIVEADVRPEVRKIDLVVRPHLECAYQSCTYNGLDYRRALVCVEVCVCGVSVIRSRQCLLLYRLTTQTMRQYIENITRVIMLSLHQA